MRWSVVVLASLAAGACGGAGGDPSPPTSEPDEAAPPPAAAPVAAAPTSPPATQSPAAPADEEPVGPAPRDTIVLRARGPELAFYPDRVSASAGSRVVLRFENAGELPHNFVLVRDEDAIDALATAAYEAGATGYVPLELRDALLAFTPLVSPGGHADVSITVPPPGEYTYICLFPGHAQMMLGTLRSLP